MANKKVNRLVPQGGSQKSKVKTKTVSNGTELITQLIFLFPVKSSLFPLSTSEFNFVRLLIGFLTI
ncbi:hypothetical protein AA650_21525 [Anabaena sp. WA102]|nr:hypothetical protein AA650_21525 [Anabaena sp. WA102]OBQ18476.1 MAG: hypothetical protein AN486_12050 [Anabaena sp. AL93]